MNAKILSIIALIATIGIVTANVDQTPYTDIILSVYTDSPDFAIIETSNWKYMYVENIKENNYILGEDISEFIGYEIIVKDLKQIGNKTVIAKILINPSLTEKVNDVEI
jgi:hypothetical protein